MTDGIILLDKPAGMTSMGADILIRKLAGTRKAGHSGTLDPFATGLLPVFTGDALKMMRYTDGYDKTYECTALFGIRTSTGDTEGEAAGGRKPDADELQELIESDFRLIRDALAQVASRDTQIPPKYSAKKINGRKAYELAREGREVELQPQKVKIYSLTVGDITVRDGYPLVSFTVSCSKGTYIRTVCEDAGEITGFSAHAVSLRRIKAGPYDIKDAVTPDRLRDMFEKDDTSFLLDRETAVAGMPAIELTDAEFEDVILGKKISGDRFAIEQEKLVRAYRGRDLAAVVRKTTEDGRTILRIDRMLYRDDR